MANSILWDLSDAPAVVAALEANLREGYVRFGRGLGAEFHEEQDALWFVTGLPFQVPNGVVRFDVAPEMAGTRIDTLLREYAARRAPSCWLVTPSTHPTDLSARLQERGYFSEFAPGMAADLDAVDLSVPLPPGLRIEPVTDTNTMAVWVHVLAVGSPVPSEVERLLLDWLARSGFHPDPAAHFFLGTLDGQPVATSLLFLGGGVAGIYSVATIPDARRRGIGAAMTLAAMREGQALGYRVAGLQSSEMGLNIYKRLGFGEYCTFGICFSPPV